MKIVLDSLKQICYKAKIRNTFPTTLTLLEKFAQIKVFDKLFLQDVTILFIQHHLSPFIGQLAAMNKNGMRPEVTWFVDIPYSTNEDVKKKIIRTYTSNSYPKPYTNPKEDYARTQIERTKTIILKILKTNLKKLLVIDDGAYFIRAVHELFIIDKNIANILYNSTYVVEQTTRGHRYLTDLKYSSIIEILNIPIVSIARSKTKLEIESPFIGIACRKAIEKNDLIRKKLKTFQNKKNKPIEPVKLKIGIIGYGAIGAAVFESIINLKKEIKIEAEIEIIEIDYSKWQEIRNLEEYPTPLSELSNNYDILFGCTGNESFGWHDRNKVNKGALLVSVSSASIEFGRGDFIEFADLYDDDQLTMDACTVNRKGNLKLNDIHVDLQFRDLENGTDIIFVNSGFPVNFTGEKECLPLAFIEPTHVLLYAASYQVLNAPKQGIQSLCDEYDNWIYYNAFNSFRSYFKI